MAIGGDLRDLGLSPAQQRVAEVVLAAGDEVAASGCGRVLFVTCPAGSGSSHLLCELEGRFEELGFRVTAGRRADSAPVEQRPEWEAPAEALVESAFSVAANFDPALSLATSVAGLSAAGAAALRAATRGPVESTELVTRVLRAAAREGPSSPMVCLVDDAAWLSGAWWTELQFSFATEVGELPLLLVLAVEEFSEQGGEDESPSRRVARSLAARNLADSVRLDELAGGELRHWLGPMPREVTKGAMELTQGRTGEVVELWRAWIDHGVLAKSAAGGWRLENADGILGDALTEISARLESLREGADRAADDLIREALAFGALEGRTFTAAAVAGALGRDQDTIEDLLDELVAEVPETGILCPPRAMEIRELSHGDPIVLWRYEFANSLLWRAAQDRSDLPTAVAAMRMRDALIASFREEVSLILPRLVRLSELAGELEEAARYRAMVSEPSAAAWAAQAERLVSADDGDWTPTDHRDAARVLSEAVLALRVHRSMEDLLELTQVAVVHGEAAGAMGQRELAHALAVEGHLYHHLGKVEMAETKVRSARELVLHGAPNLLADTLRQLAELVRDRSGNIEEQRELLDDALPLYRRVRNVAGEASVNYNLAGISSREGDFARARELNEKALVAARAIAERDLEVDFLQQRAGIEEKAGNLDLARELIKEVLRRKSANDVSLRSFGGLSILATVELKSGNFEEAWSAGQSALDVARGPDGGAWGEARALHVLGDTAVALGKAEQGEIMLREAQVILQRLHDRSQLSKVEEKLEGLEGAG